MPSRQTWGRWLLACIAITSLLGQWQRWETPWGKISAYEILMALFIAFSWSNWRWYWRQTWQRPLVWLGLLWLIWLGIATGLNAWLGDNPLVWQVGLSYGARLGLYAAFWWSFAGYLQRYPEQRKCVRQGLLFTLVGQLFLGLGQYLFVPDTRWLQYLGWDDHLNRALGTLLDPGYFGLLMVWGALLAFDSYLGSKATRPRTGWAVLFAGFVLATALSFSRTSYVAYAIGFLVYAFLRRQRRISLAIPLLILALVVIPRDGGGEGQKLLRTNSIAARTEVLDYHAQAFQGRDWLIGQGWYYEGALQLHERALGKPVEDEQRSANHAQAVDNAFVHVLFSAGLPGLSIFAVWLGLVWHKIRYLPVAAAGFITVLIHSLFSMALFYPWVLLWGGGLLIAFFIGEEPRSHHKSN